MHFGVGLPSREDVLALRERFVGDGIELVEEWNDPDYVSIKCRDPVGYIVEASWEPGQRPAHRNGCRGLVLISATGVEHEGAPRLYYGEPYYTMLLRDPDGVKIEVVRAPVS